MKHPELTYTICIAPLRVLIDLHLTSVNISITLLEGLILKLKLRYFGHLMRRPDSFEKTLRLGKIEGRRRRGRQRMRLLDVITNSKDKSLSKL